MSIEPFKAAENSLMGPVENGFVHSTTQQVRNVGMNMRFFYRAMNHHSSTDRFL